MTGGKGWTSARLAVCGGFAAVFVAAAAALLVAYGWPWFTTAATGTVSGVSAHDALAAQFAAGAGHVGAAAPAVPMLLGMPAVLVLLLAAALTATAAVAGRNAVLVAPAMLAWLAGSAAASSTARGFGWAPVGPATVDAGWQLVSVVSALLPAAMLPAAVFVAAVNHQVRGLAGTGSGAALDSVGAVLLRGAALRGATTAGAQAAMAAERTDHL